MGSVGLLPLASARPLLPRQHLRNLNPNSLSPATRGLFNDYRFRGFTQTDYQARISGRLSTSHTSRASTWAIGTRTCRRLCSTARRSRWISTGATRRRLATSGSTSASSTTTTLAPASFAPYKAKNFEAYIGGVVWSRLGQVLLLVHRFLRLSKRFPGLTAPIKGSQYLDITVTVPAGWRLVDRGARRLSEVKNYGSINRAEQRRRIRLQARRYLRYRGLGLAPRRLRWSAPTKSRSSSRSESLPEGGGKSGFLHA